MNQDIKHENPPTIQAAKKPAPDDYEYVLLTVTERDRINGTDQTHEYLKRGWVRVDPKKEPEFATTMENQFYIKRLKREVQADRAAALAQYQSWTEQKAEAKSPNPQLGSGIVEVKDRDQQTDSILSPAEQSALAAAAAAANK